MKVFKNLFGDGSKINAGEIVIKNKGEIDTLEEISDRSLLQYSSLKEITKFAPESYMNRYHAIQISGEFDMNDVVYSGLYYVVANDARNTPTNANGYLLVISAHAGHCVQMYMTTSRTDYNIYLRKYISGSGWGDWGTNS